MRWTGKVAATEAEAAAVMWWKVEAPAVEEAVEVATAAAADVVEAAAA